MDLFSGCCGKGTKRECNLFAHPCRFSYFPVKMPDNLHALTRYRTIDRCLQHRRRRWTWRELSEACGEALREQVRADAPDPSRRTIMADIRNMRGSRLGYEAPIEWDARAGTYRYADPEYSISRSPLNREDLHQLYHVLSILRHYEAFDQVEGLNNIVARLAHALHDRQPDRKAIVHLDINELLAGRKWLPVLYDAVDREQCLILQYQPFRADVPERRLLSPYLLKEYNNRWFLVGWEHRKGQVYTLPIDRIRDVEPALLESFYRIPGFDPDTRYRHVIGVTVPDRAPVETVLLRVDAGQARYVDTKPLHPTQEVRERRPAYTVFAYRLIRNYELESRILAMGEAAEVLQPESLRQALAERARKLAERY